MFVAEREREVRVLARHEAHERLAAVPHVIVAEVVVQDGRCQADFALGELPRFRWLHQVKRPSAQRDTDRFAEEQFRLGVVAERLVVPLQRLGRARHAEELEVYRAERRWALHPGAGHERPSFHPVVRA